MSLFNQLIRGSGAEMDLTLKEAQQARIAKPRTFKEQIADQIAYHQRKIDDLQAVHDSLTPDVERFVEAIQKL